MSDELHDLPPIERLQVVEIRPNDTILVSVPTCTAVDQLEALLRHFTGRWPNNEITVLAGDIELAVYRPSDETGARE